MLEKLRHKTENTYKYTNCCKIFTTFYKIMNLLHRITFKSSNVHMEFINLKKDFLITEKKIQFKIATNIKCNIDVCHAK